MARNEILEKTTAQAMWIAEDQRLAVEQCYRGRWGTWRNNMAHLDLEP